MSTDIADALRAAEWRNVLRSPHARCLRRKERALLRLLDADGTRLGRDGVAAVQLPIKAVNEQIESHGKPASNKI